MLRSVLVLSWTALAMVAPQSRAHSDSWPSRSIRLIVPFVAASSSDTIARLIALKWGEQLGQQIVVENRVGGSTIIGTDAVAKAAPDGYTLGIANTTTHVATAALSPNLPFDPLRDFAPIAMIGSSPFVLISSPHTPAASLQDFIALAKARPGELNYASAGTATLTHLAGELFKWKANVAVAHIPYRGTAQSMFDLMQGRINLMVGTIPPTLPHIREGKLKALATMSDKRNDALPDVPTVAEAGVPGAEAGLWTAFVTPSGVPADIMRRLTASLLTVLSTDEVQKGLRTHGVDPEPQPPDVVALRIKDDLAKWRAVVHAAKIVGAN